MEGRPETVFQLCSRSGIKHPGGGSGMRNTGVTHLFTRNGTFISGFAVYLATYNILPVGDGCDQIGNFHYPVWNLDNS